MSFEQQQLSLNGQSIHVRTIGKSKSAKLLMLHGFPEYWAAWRDVAQQLEDAFYCILPDQRGFNYSSKPQGEEAYLTKHLVADMVALIDHISPNEPVVLCGHDWGASVAYALAMRFPEKVSSLVIANGVHPICFQKALYAGSAQTDASQYMNVLRAQGSEDRLRHNNYEKLLGMFEKFSAAPWLTEDIKDQYREAWSRDNALPTMLNWYRSSPMIVPKSGTPAQAFSIEEEHRKKFRIAMPHLLLWGLQDTALLPDARADLSEFCDDLTTVETNDASHWILHEKPQWVANHIRSFIETAA